MKILLTSAGITNDKIAQALSSLAEQNLSDLKILFIPSAANTERDDKRWLIKNLVDIEKQQFKSIDISDIAALTENEVIERFDSADILCFGGGNAFYLAEILNRPFIKEYFVNFPKDKVYMGISAGSMVTGRFMPEDLYSKIFPEENFGSITKEALGLCDLCFIPHLNSDFFKNIRKENLESLKQAFLTDVYATDDETAISINNNKIKIIGQGEYWLHKNLSPKLR